MKINGGIPIWYDPIPYVYQLGSYKAQIALSPYRMCIDRPEFWGSVHTVFVHLLVIPGG